MHTWAALSAFHRARTDCVLVLCFTLPHMQRWPSHYHFGAILIAFRRVADAYFVLPVGLVPLVVERVDPIVTPGAVSGELSTPALAYLPSCSA